MKLGVPIVWWKGSFSRHPQLFAFAHLPNGQGKANATHLEPGSFGKSNAGVDLPLVVALGGPTHPLPTPTTIHSHPPTCVTYVADGTTYTKQKASLDRGWEVELCPF